ncbi:MAG TPA: hypothetical protein VFA13_06400, partial [Candidatus Acidoferrum sp.]|nr:hypothetical protein [Candidatus Acidoferrum sp.]
MKFVRLPLLILAAGCAAGAWAAQPSAQQSNSETASGAAKPAPAPQNASSEAAKGDSARAGAYYNYTIGHIFEQQYEATS